MAEDLRSVEYTDLQLGAVCHKPLDQDLQKESECSSANMELATIGKGNLQPRLALWIAERSSLFMLGWLPALN